MATKPEAKFVISADNRASGVIAKVGQDFNRLGEAASSAAGFASRMAGPLSAVAAIGASFSLLVKSTADTADNMGKLAQRVGVGVESLSELNYAARLSDVSTEELGTALTRLTAKIGDVAQGSENARGWFDALGVRALDSSGKMRSADEVLKDIAERFSQFQDGAEKTAFSLEIFGRGGAKLIPLLNAGRIGLEQSAAEARRFGLVLKDETSKAAEEFNDNLTRISAAAEGFKLKMLGPVVQSLAGVTTAFREARREGLGFWDSINAKEPVFELAGKNIADQIAEEEKKLAALQRNLESTNRSTRYNLFGAEQAKKIQNDIDETTRKLEALRRVQLRISGIGDAPDIKLPPPAPPESDEAKKRRERFLKDTGGLDSLVARELLEEEARLKALAERWRDLADPTREYIRQLEEIRYLVKEGELSPEAGIAAEFEVQSAMQDKLIKPIEKTKNELEEYAEAWLDTIDPMREFTRELEKIDKAVAAGFLSPDQAAGIKERLAGVNQQFGEMSEFALQAARNIQDALGNTVFEVLDGNFKSIGRSFANLLKRMVAEAIAADIGRTLLGNFGATGQIGGLVGSFFGSITGGAAPVPALASGGSVSAGRLYQVGEYNRPELLTDGSRQWLIPGNAGKVSPMSGASGGVTISQSFTINGSSGGRTEAAQLAARVKAETMSAIREASLRNDPAAAI